ncbi:MAG: hypothetical protein KDD41_12035 [Flavobacteriales bacterium]|nr:hypothetical protein [Flavobacteriales bacterium]
MPRIILAISFIIFSFCSVAQNYTINNERTISALYNIQIDTSADVHSSIKPLYKNELKQYDSTMTGLNVKTNSGFVKTLMNYNLDKDPHENTAEIMLSPILATGFTYEKNSLGSDNFLDLSAGLNLNMHIKKKWTGNFVYLWDFSKYPSYVDTLIKTKNISPGYGYTDGDKGFYAQGNLTFTADDHFTFQLGYGKNFIGDGYRSLFLSDNAFSYPYLKLTANIWKLKYMALYSSYEDIRGSGGSYSNFFHKFSTVHYLSYNATKWLNFGFFESIIWQAQEDGYYRGFDAYYLNPVIFLRPAEYAQGSSDNAFLGGSMKIRIKKKNILYSQLLFDEFLLKELKAGNGWWANKYGIQLGLKSYDFLWVKNLTLQLEYNTVRPFTYSYYHVPGNISTLQNYGHYNAALAHPLGANFKELMGGLTYTEKRWIVEGTATWAKVGLDTSATTSIGQDIFKAYNTRAQNYGYVTGGGLSTDILNGTLKASYVINPKTNFIFQVGITNRIIRNQHVKASNQLFFIGLKTAITNRYTDY